MFWAKHKTQKWVWRDSIRTLCCVVMNWTFWRFIRLCYFQTKKSACANFCAFATPKSDLLDSSWDLRVSLAMWFSLLLVSSLLLINPSTGCCCSGVFCRCNIFGCNCDTANGWCIKWSFFRKVWDIKGILPRPKTNEKINIHSHLPSLW